MKCHIYKTPGKKANDIALDFKEDLNHHECELFSIENLKEQKTCENCDVIFIIMVSNTMNTYISDLKQKEKKMYDIFFLVKRF